MDTYTNIKRLIDDYRIDEALKMLSDIISANADDDRALLMRGKLYWRLQRFADAVNDFEAAVAANPDSDARHALEMARDIYDFYNPDLLNP